MTSTQQPTAPTDLALATLHSDLRFARFRCDYSARTRVILVEGDSGKWWAIRWSAGDSAHRVTATDALLFGTQAVINFLEDN